MREYADWLGIDAKNERVCEPNGLSQRGHAAAAEAQVGAGSRSL